MRSYGRVVLLALLPGAVHLAGCAQPGCRLEKGVQHVVPFDAYDDLPLVNCSVNGHPAVPFLVDTGAATNVMDYESAGAMGVFPTSEQYRSLQGLSMRDASIDELTIGTFKSKDVRTRVMNLADVLPDGHPAKGILGYPLFRPLELCIDYPRHTVTFREGACRRLKRSFAPVFTFVVVPVLVENQGPYNFVLDTGSNMSLVEPHVLRELNPPQEASVPVVRIKMDGLEGFAWPREDTSPRSKGVSDVRDIVRKGCGVRIDGVLGWRHMKDYRVVLNYPTCTYQFEKIGYPSELKPVIVSVSPDLSRGYVESALQIREIVFEFSVPMRRLVSYLTTFECEHEWQDDTHLKLILREELAADTEYEVILGQGFLSQNNVPLDWSPYRFKMRHD